MYKKNKKETKKLVEVEKKTSTEEVENDFDFDENDENLIVKAFQHFDVDHNGKVNVEEIKHVLTFLGDIMTEDEVNKIFKTAEIDKNGYIDYKEFINFWMNNA